MKFIADLHLHSKYSRAVSPEMIIPNLALWGEKKGIKVLGTGDWTHPEWLKELKRDLRPAEPGLFKFKKYYTRFLLSTEISSIYKKDNKVRKIHNLVFAPDFKSVDKINGKLNKIGNLKSDGRPILGLDSEELLKIVLGVNENCILVPAHIWTPWFSLFGSRSGFDSIKECFGENSKYIYAIETGLSSDPAMNWRIKDLNNITILSFGDAHSLPKLGREATVFNCKLDYFSIIKSIKNNKIVETLEFFPEEGKYYYDGHRDCGICFAPEQTKKHKNICPKCGKELVVGVMNRVQELANQSAKQRKHAPLRSLIPLQEILSEVYGVGVNSKRVQSAYEELVEGDHEFNILLNKKMSGRLGLALERMRVGDINISPGFDGEFGKIKIFNKDDNKKNTLF